MEAINRTKLITLINDTKGGFFTVVFFKKDGSMRTMTCRKGVKAYLKGGVNKVVKPANAYVTVFEMSKKEYRTINLETITEVHFNKTIYRVV